MFPVIFLRKMTPGCSRLSTVRAKFKLSQNRNAVDHAGVVAGLESVGNDALAAAMKAAEPGGQ